VAEGQPKTHESVLSEENKEKMKLSSCSGLLSLLDESDDNLKIHSLKQLADNSIINNFWSEIAPALPKM
jgi:hypothetical protein